MGAMFCGQRPVTANEFNAYRRDKVPTPHLGNRKIKIVVVGDTKVGKTCFILNYINETFSE